MKKLFLTAAAIYWPIANSSLNLLFLLGFRHMGYLWAPLTVIASAVTLFYGVSSLYLVSRKKTEFL